MFVIHRVRQVGSAEFWSNRIRKEYRNKDDEVSKAQITFCVKLSSLVKELSAYTKEWHTTGLAWGKGAALTKSAAQAGVDTVSAATTPTATATVKTKGAESKTVKAAPPVKSAADASEELKAALLAKTTGGNSAATGLKKVSTYIEPFSIGRRDIADVLSTRFMRCNTLLFCVWHRHM
mmetsp:Transcript_8108/g.17613  ORF Transcript_8108/g.17613 Transcript_8108/m.17613 type:complete len:178 (+) Transcript_8108:675-1208(+)